MKLTFEYYHKIQKAIEESKTFGNLIDKFKITRDNLMKDLELELSVNKYNL